MKVRKRINIKYILITICAICIFLLGNFIIKNEFDSKKYGLDVYFNTFEVSRYKYILKELKDNGVNVKFSGKIQEDMKKLIEITDYYKIDFGYSYDENSMEENNLNDGKIAIKGILEYIKERDNILQEIVEKYDLDKPEVIK